MLRPSSSTDQRHSARPDRSWLEKAQQGGPRTWFDSGRNNAPLTYRPFLPDTQGGWVFSVGSMTFTGSLIVDPVLLEQTAEFARRLTRSSIVL
jgi:hypothetical protein